MKKTIKKLNYVNVYSIGEYESWLSDMAKKGMMLKAIKSRRNTFLECDPCDMEYRVELSDKPMATERIEIYKESGWDYVCSYKDIHIFSAFNSEKTIDIYTDLKEQNLTLNNLTLKSSYLSLVMFIGTILTIVLGHGILFIGNTPHINLYNGDWKIFGIIFGMMLIFAFSIILRFRCSHIRRKLLNSNAINHHTNWKKSYVLNFCLTNIILFFYILYSIFVVVDVSYAVKNTIERSNGNYFYNLSVDSIIPVPIARLADFVQGKNEVLKQYDDSDKGNLYNRVKKEQGLLIKNYYKVTEKLLIEPLSESDNSQPSLTTHYYELMIPNMSDGVLEDLVNASEDSYDGEKQSIEIKYDNLDKVYYLDETEGLYSIFVRKGNIVEHVTYCGSLPYEIVLGAIAKSLNN